MNTVYIPSDGGCGIPADCTIRGDEKLLCVIMHGFASSRKSSTAQLMLEHCASLGAAAIAFDWPCHGDSVAPYTALTVDRCQSDLRAVERWAHERAPQAEVVYFGSSFGGYNALLHLCSGESLGKRAFLRSGAVNMNELLTLDTPGVREALAERGFWHYDAGFGDGLDLCEAFFTTLTANSPFALELPRGAEVWMLHGAEDTVIDPAAAQRYAAEKRCLLTLVPGTGHSIDSEQGIDALLRLTKSFFFK